MNPSFAAQLLLATRQGGPAVDAQTVLALSPQEAYAVQDATLAHMGPIGGWKVGAAGPNAEPGCAPLPASCLVPSGAVLQGAPWVLRGVEVEVALRLGRDLDPQGLLLSPEELAPAFDAVLPVIEVVESRLADREASGPLAQMADLMSHGALVLGPPSSVLPAQVDLRTVDARLAFGDQTVVDTHGGNPAADIWRLVAWLALHCAQRGHPLRAGQIITTGSCTGMLQAPAGALVQAQLAGIGDVAVQF